MDPPLEGTPSDPPKANCDCKGSQGLDTVLYFNTAPAKPFAANAVRYE